MTTHLVSRPAEAIELTLFFNAQGQPLFDRTTFERLRNLKVGDKVEVDINLEKLTGHTFKYVITYEIKVGETGTFCKRPRYQPYERTYPTPYPARLGSDFAPQVGVADTLVPVKEPHVVFIVEKERQLQLGPLQVPTGSALVLQHRTDGFLAEHDREVQSAMNRFRMAGHRNPREIRDRRALDPSPDLDQLRVTIRRVRPAL